MRRVRERFPGVPIAGLDLPDEALSDDWRAGLPCLFGDATALPFPDGAFDLVLAIEVLEHVPGRTRALAELARVPRHARRLGAVRADLAGRQHGPPPLRQGLGQHARPRQPLEALGLPPLRRRALRRRAGRSPLPWTIVKRAAATDSCSP